MRPLALVCLMALAAGGATAGAGCAVSLGPSCPSCLPEGSACLPSSAGVDGGGCISGTSCLTVRSQSVCAVGCDPSGNGAPCPDSQVCAVESAGDGGLIGLCEALGVVGQACGTVALTACAQPAVCIESLVKGTGVCVAFCDPAAPELDCPSNQSCLSPFGALDSGFCGTPVAPGQSCDDSQDAFCPSHQLCLPTVDGGSCLTTCNPGSPSTCTAPQSCLAFGDAGVGLCAQPQALGQPCAFDRLLFCANAALCISSSTDAGLGTCALDCSQGQACPMGETCQATTHSAFRFCAAG